MRTPTEMETPLLLLRDGIRIAYNDVIFHDGGFSSEYEGGMLGAYRRVISHINDMLDVATLGDFDGCKTQPIEGELE